MHKLGVIALNQYSYFAVLSSTIHNIWCWKNSSTLGAGTLNYSTTDCFETFPMPQLNDNLNNIGRDYHTHRKYMQHFFEIGLTKLYNQFHNPQLETIPDEIPELPDKEFEKLYGKESLSLKKHLLKREKIHSFVDFKKSIITLRKLHAELDKTILITYGWGELQLIHNYYELPYLPDKDNVRFTIPPNARKEILKRLLLLNHQLY